MGILSIRDVQSASCHSYSRADGVFRSPEHLLWSCVSQMKSGTVIVKSVQKVFQFQ